jgi:general L-amino acid transport system substrate-binding protein
MLLMASVVECGILQEVVDRGYLVCGVSFTNILFGEKQGLRGASGFDMDYCRAVAAAIFGENIQGRLEFLEVDPTERFRLLRDRVADVMVRTTTATLGRDTVEGVTFTRPNFYDGQGFMVRDESGIESLEALDVDGNSYCVTAETTTASNADEFMQRATAMFAPTELDASDMFHRGECTAFTGDVTTLQAFQRLGDRILPDKISREPLAAATTDADQQWATIVKYVVNALVLADFYGVHKGNIDELDVSNAPLELRQLLGDATWQVDELLGTTWARNALANVGGYGELYSRHIGAALPRHGTENALWIKGGLQYAEVWSGPSEPAFEVPEFTVPQIDKIRERGFLRCGVKTDSPLFALLDAATVDDGNGFPVVRGFDADFCRALALAVFASDDGPAPGAIDLRERLEFVAVSSSDRFARLVGDEYDVLVRQTTATLGRDAINKVSFARPNFYDGQGFMVRDDSGIRSLVGLDLPTRTYCVARGTTTLLTSKNFFKQAEAFETANEPDARDAYRLGKCDALTSDTSQLADSFRPGVDRLLPETISREPLAPGVSDYDVKWGEINAWVLNGLVIAERWGLDRVLIALLGDAPLQDTDALRQLPAEARNLLGVNSYNATGLDVHPKFMRWILAEVGNYGKIYERHLEQRIPRNGTLNDLWINENGGLIFAEPWIGVSQRVGTSPSTNNSSSLPTSFLFLFLLFIITLVLF